MGLQAYDVHAIDNNRAALSSTDGVGFSGLVYAASGGTRVAHILATSTSVVDHDVVLASDYGGSTQLAIVNVPALSGSSSTIPTVDVLASLPGGMDAIVLAPGETLLVGMAVVLGPGETITLYAVAADF